MRGTKQNGPWFPTALRPLASLAVGCWLLATPGPGLRCDAQAGSSTPRPASGGYLARIGPPPLRFAAIPSRASAVLWPPLSTGATAAQSEDDKPEQAPDPTNALDTLFQPLPEPHPAETAPTDLVSLPTNRETVITPQMLDEYLKPAEGVGRDSATNAAAPPVWFMPPIPVKLPGSEATYRSPEPTHAN